MRLVIIAAALALLAAPAFAQSAPDENTLDCKDVATAFSEQRTQYGDQLAVAKATIAKMQRTIDRLQAEKAAPAKEAPK